MLAFVQMVEDLRGLLQLADEKRQASLAELSVKHHKVKFMWTLGKTLATIHEEFFLQLLLKIASH